MYGTRPLRPVHGGSSHLDVWDVGAGVVRDLTGVEWLLFYFITFPVVRPIVQTLDPLKLKTRMLS